MDRLGAWLDGLLQFFNQGTATWFQHDATGTAATGAIAMLAVFAAALIFDLQHVGERYTPALHPIIIRQSSRWMFYLAALVLITSFTILLPGSTWVEVVAVGSLVASVVISLCGAYWLWRLTETGPTAVALLYLLPDAPRYDGAVDILGTAIARGDRRTTGCVLKVFGAGSERHAALLDWLSNQRDLLKPEWVTTETVQSIRGGLAGGGAERLQNPISRILDDALNNEDYGRADAIVSGSMRGLESTESFLKEQSALAFHLGFTIWYHGEEGARDPRLHEQGTRYSYLKDTFILELKRVWDTVLERADSAQVTAICQVVMRLQQEDIPVVFNSSIVFGILEDGGIARLLEQSGLEDLASAVGAARHSRRAKGSELDQDRLDSLAELVALWVAELGAPDQVIRILGNAGVLSLGQPQRLATKYAFTRKSETAVANAFEPRGRR